MTDAQAFATMQDVVRAFPVPGVDSKTLKLYATQIQDLDYAATTAAMRAMMNSREETRRPSIAEIRKAVLAQMAKSDSRMTYLAPDEAWGHVKGCFTSVGQYRPFPQTFPAVASVVRSMGWEEMCRSDNMEATRAHFMKLYEVAVNRSQSATLQSDGLSLPPSGAVAERAQQVGASATKQVAGDSEDAPRIEGPTTVQALREHVEKVAAKPMPAPEPIAVEDEHTEPTVELTAEELREREVEKERRIAEYKAAIAAREVA